METTMKVPGTALERDLEKWQKKQEGYINKYGTSVMNDRDFMKAKREVLKDIYDRHKNSRLGMDDKIEMAILKGQIKQMNERIQPSRVLRFAAGLLKFLGRPLEHIGKLMLNVASTFLIGKPVFDAHKNRLAQRASVNRPSGQPQLSVREGENQMRKQSPEEKVSVVRRLSRERVLTEMPKQAKGVTR